MPDFRKIATTGLISLTLAVASIVTITPAFARGGEGGGFGGGSHAGGMHEGEMHEGGMREGGMREGGLGIGHSNLGAAPVHAFSRYDHFDGRFRGRRVTPFFGSDSDYDNCYWRTDIRPFGRPIATEVCD